MLLDLFNGALADRADSLALDDLSYRELFARAARVAGAFARSGAAPGDRVAIYAENSHAFVLAYLAVLQLGAIAVPVNVLYRSRDLAHVLADAQPALIVCSPAGAAVLREVDLGNARTVTTLQIDAWAVDDAALLTLAVRVDPESTALIVYTSGTTGASKGAMLSHRNLAAIASQLMAAWRWRSDDVLLLTLPLFHIHGLIAGLTTSLAAGGRIVLRERFAADDVLALLRGSDITAFFGVPTMYVRLIERLRADGGSPPPPLRLYVSGSAALSAQTHEEFAHLFGASILERYGATEFGFALTNRYAGPRIAGSVGIPFPGVRVRIAAPDDPLAVALPPPEIGELLVAGPNVFGGYWNLPEATASAFATDAQGSRWYRSGDLARYDAPCGAYRIVGRIKELIITGGFNVYPREVEDAVEAVDGVRACAVVGKPDAARGEYPVAFIECDGDIDAAALTAILRGRLASFKIPKEIHAIDALPRNAMGKIDKPALRRLA